MLQLSGIVALFFSGVFHAHYSYYSVAPDAQITLRRFFQFAAFLSETFVFAYLGLQVCTAGIFSDLRRPCPAVVEGGHAPLKSLPPLLLAFGHHAEEVNDMQAALWWTVWGPIRSMTYVLEQPT